MRLTGLPLVALRHGLRLPAVRALAWRLGRRDLGVDLLAELPASARSRVGDGPAPLAGAPPRGWTHDDLPPRPARAGAAALQRAFSDGSTSPTEVLEDLLGALGRGELGEARHSPWVSLDVEGARRAAAAAGERLRAHRPLGPLDGVCVPIKDHLDVAGLPTHGGTAHRRHRATTDAFVVDRLRRGGAVLLGTTHATEWGLNALGTNAHACFPGNVHDGRRAPGGSSTGSGVAVALGHAPVALGSDGGGSLRVPAALQGIYALKPTFQRLGRSGDTWARGSLGHLGPLGATVGDLVALLAVTAARDPDDPATWLAPDGHDPRPWWDALRRGVRGARLGVVASAWADADGPVAAACEEGLRALESAGARLVDVTLPHESVAPAVGALLIVSEACANLSDDRSRHARAYGDEITVTLAAMSGLSAEELLGAARVRTRLRETTAQLFRTQVDLLAMPTTASVAPPIPRRRPADLLDPAATAALVRFTFLANLTGLPAGTAPVGRVGGLPVGLQLVGDAWDEASVIAGLAALERSGVGLMPPPRGHRHALA